MSSTSPSYRRVAQRVTSDPAVAAASASSSGDIFEVQPTRSRKERLEDKCFALAWVIVACIVARYTNFFSIVFLLNTDTTATGTSTTTTTTDDNNNDNNSSSNSTSTSENNLQPNKILLRLAFVGVGIITTLFLYLTLYLPKIKGLPRNDPSVWNVYCPKVIPIMGITSIMTYLLLIRALWPIFGFLSPLISGTEIMGLVMVTHFIPAVGFC